MAERTLKGKKALVAAGAKNLGGLISRLAAEGWWITGRRSFANGGHTTR